MSQVLPQTSTPSQDYPGRDLSSLFDTGRPNKPTNQDGAFHSWYSFVLSFPPHLVRYYLDDFDLPEGGVVLDPFCGTGTTLVEARLRGYRALGIEANPFAHFASSVKLDWSIDPQELASAASRVAAQAYSRLADQGLNDWDIRNDRVSASLLKRLPEEAERLLIDNSVSPLPLHKSLVLLDCIRSLEATPFYNHALLAFASALVFSISNLRFGPEVGVGKPKRNTPVIPAWVDRISRICSDLSATAPGDRPSADVYLFDARDPASVLPTASVDAVITSPPYPNEKDYTRTTRLESVVLGFINSRQELRGFKMRLVRSNTRSVYKGDDDDLWVAGNPEIERIASTIEQRRLHLGKTSGFERLYARLTKLYFGGMARHLANLRDALRPGAQLAYVVGDQASYLRVMIPTGRLLADIAASLGYQPLRIDLFRNRFSTATRSFLREEVVVLRWTS